MRLLFTILLSLPILTTANNSDLFKYDQGKVATYLNDLESIEQQIQHSKEDYVTMEDLKPEIFAKTNLASSANFSAVYGDPPLGIPSFVWGLCCGLAGIAIVYFTTEDTDETKKALYGCATTTVVYAVLYFAGVAATIASY